VSEWYGMYMYIREKDREIYRGLCLKDIMGSIVVWVFVWAWRYGFVGIGIVGNCGSGIG
jgi:hypothetical protein